MIKVLIVDDQDLMLQGLSMIVGKEQELEVVGQCRDGREAVSFCEINDVDIILMDIRMPNMNGVDATKVIKEMNETIRIIILTTFNDDDYIFSSLRYGASGYLLKDATPVEITSAIKKVFEGGTLINPDVTTKLVNVIQQENLIINSTYGSSFNESQNQEKGEIDFELTNREKDICHLLAEGKNNKEIGQSLMISDGTVKNNITRILDKLDMRDRTQLALFALKNKI